MSSSESSSGVSSTSLSHAPVIRSPKDLARLSIGALGVVYGDIGTSPLYTIRECFSGEHGVAVSTGNVLGVLSLVFWALTLIVVLKYVVLVLRADHNGEGGILALLALVTEQRSHPSKGESGHKRFLILMILALFGFSLLLGEGMITPAISVLGALEGLDVATPFFAPYVVPLAMAILLGLFLVQKRGTARIGAWFGPAMLIWFGVIAVLGLPAIVREPQVLSAIDPTHAVRFFFANGVAGFLVLGAVVLAVTGAEALYADLGHLGRRPIRVSWLGLAFPALVLNYFGQGALLLSRQGGQEIVNPFFELVPKMLLYPAVVLATAAAIIASQAMISGAFSLAQQAVQLGYLPRLTIVHTSQEARGQIYVPEINGLLAVACLGLVLTFQSSGRLAAAYGISVMGTFMCTTVLLGRVARHRWGWGRGSSAALVVALLALEVPLFAANVPKFPHGGWFPFAIGTIFFVTLMTWKRGRALLRAQLDGATLPLESFIGELGRSKPVRVSGTAVFLASSFGRTPSVLLHHFKHNKVLHEKVVLLTVITEGVPEIPVKRRVEIAELGEGFFQVTAHYGFMQTPNVPEVLRICHGQGLETSPSTVSYFLGRETVLPTGRGRMARWRKRLFILLHRNARSAASFFDLPTNRVVELGGQVEL
jgi:KUP system potassium uptake protein